MESFVLTVEACGKTSSHLHRMSPYSPVTTKTAPLSASAPFPQPHPPLREPSNTVNSECFEDKEHLCLNSDQGQSDDNHFVFRCHWISCIIRSLPMPGVVSWLMGNEYRRKEELRTRTGIIFSTTFVADLLSLKTTKSLRGDLDSHHLLLCKRIVFVYNLVYFKDLNRNLCLSDRTEAFSAKTIDR